MSESDDFSLRGKGRAVMLPNGAMPLPTLEQATGYSQMTGKLLDQVCWDYDPSRAVLSGQVDVARFFENFPWSGSG